MEGGFEGWYKLEIFSDDGTYGEHFEDSLWDLPHPELLRMTREAFDESYTRAQELVAVR